MSVNGRGQHPSLLPAPASSSRPFRARSPLGRRRVRTIRPRRSRVYDLESDRFVPVGTSSFSSTVGGARLPNNLMIPPKRMVMVGRGRCYAKKRAEPWFKRSATARRAFFPILTTPAAERTCSAEHIGYSGASPYQRGLPLVISIQPATLISADNPENSLLPPRIPFRFPAPSR